MTRLLVAGASAAATFALLHRRAATDAARWATLLRIVARAGRDMNRLGSGQVLEGVVGGVREMGFDSANISIIDEAAGKAIASSTRTACPPTTWTPVHPATIGMTGMVRARRATVAAADYGTQATAVPRLAQVGFTSAVGSPIWVAGELAGVLVGGSKRHRKLRDEEVEAFELLAAHASIALENAARFEELERSRAQVRHQAEHDALTGLANRRLFRERVEAAHAGALLYIDLDGFKGVNDFLGHAAGDELLKIVAERLRRGLRPGDTAARLGGDEFAVLLDGAGADDAEAAAQRPCREALNAQVRLDGRLVTLGASIGVATIVDGADADQSMRAADAAMYEQKRRRRTPARP